MRGRRRKDSPISLQFIGSRTRTSPSGRVTGAERCGALATKHTKWGLWLCYQRLRALGYAWNRKRVYRVYCALRRPRLVLEVPAILNRTWPLDFMGDTRYDGRQYRTLNVLDAANREALAIEIATSLPSVRVVALLDQLVALHGVHRHHIAPGKPNQRAFVERFNRTSRTEVLDA